jgi:hypothetical protein
MTRAIALCTICGEAIDSGESFIAGIVVPDGINLVWACEHHLYPERTITLGSEVCTSKWLEQDNNREYEARIEQLLAEPGVELI